MPKPDEQQEEDQSLLSQILGKLPRMILTWIVISYAINMFKGNDQVPTNSAINSTRGPRVLMPSFRLGKEMDLYFYLDELDEFSDFDNEDKLLLVEKNIGFGDYSNTLEKDFVIECTPKLQNNGSLYGHFYMVPTGTQLVAGQDPESVIYHKKELARLMPRRKIVQRKNLINSPQIVEEDSTKNEWIRYWWPNVTLAIVATDSPISNLPPQIMERVKVDKKQEMYFPIFYTNDFWMLQESLMPINSTVEKLDIHLSFAPMSMWKFQLYVQFEESFKLQVNVMGMDPAEHDQMKKMFTDTNPVLLAITAFVSLLHSIFDFLAFKNDVSFWKNKKNMEGLSFRSILLNVGFQFVILLYLLDNDTSYLVCFSSVTGLLIEIWKINKAVLIKTSNKFPFVEFHDRCKLSPLELKTQEYDRMAFGYLSYLFFPLMICYTIYSIIYEQHKSWYSFVIGTLVGFVYTFGFISMTPQLFINYKLKSVAHMPWKTFMYKSLNTFVDDLFAFVIKMPWLHRLACLRDDVIFFVYLYQRWIYPEDKRRRNEFGQVGTDGATIAKEDSPENIELPDEVDVQQSSPLEKSSGEESSLRQRIVKSK